MITFSNREMRFPSLRDSLFEMPLYYTWPRGGIPHQNPLNEAYSWIEREEPLHQINSLSGLSWNPLKGKKHSRILLKSPVNGLYMGGDVFSGFSALLLPEGEEVPSNAAKIVYGDLCQYCDQNRNFLFQSGRAKRDYTNAEIDAELHRILSFATTDFVLTPLNPEHLPYIRDAQPSIFEQLSAFCQSDEEQNLVDRAQPAKFKEVIHQEQQPDSVRHVAAEYPIEVQSLMEKWGLGFGFTYDHLDDQYAVFIKNAPGERFIKKMESEYTLLERFANAA